MTARTSLRLAPLLLGLTSSALVGCATVGPGERGVKRTLGKLDDEIHGPGAVFFNPFITSVERLPVRTTNVEVNLSLPSKEGLTIQAEISILYRIEPEAVIEILETVGPDYERALILTTFRSAAANIASKHLAKDMHSGERANIESEITVNMNQLLQPRGFLIENVLLKSISLPRGLAVAIEEKLAAEQEAQRMVFVLEREGREAERKKTEALGIRDAQQIIDEGLTPRLLQWKTIEAFRELSTSPNTKVIFTDGRTPLLVPPDLSGAP